MLLSLCLSVLLSAAPEDPLAAIEAHQQKLFEKVAPAVVLISTGDGFGSGFFVSRDGLILTNQHVVENRAQVEVVLYDGRKLTGTVVERGADKVDVALVQVPLADTLALPLGSIADVRVGSWVGAIGHGKGAIWTFNTGMVSNIYPEGAERPVFQTQIPLNPGNSGGPIFDRQGRVVGLVTSGIMSAQAINFGIGMEVARKVLSKLATSCECLTLLAPAGVPIFVEGTMVGVGPRVVFPVGEKKTVEVFAVIAGKMKKGKVTYPATREVKLE